MLELAAVARTVYEIPNTGPISIWGKDEITRIVLYSVRTGRSSALSKLTTGLGRQDFGRNAHPRNDIL